MQNPPQANKKRILKRTLFRQDGVAAGASACASPDPCKAETPQAEACATGTYARQPSPSYAPNSNRPSPGASLRPSPIADRQPAEIVSTGIPEIDSLAGGLPRGGLTEICGPPCSGGTSLLVSALGRAQTSSSEVCALIDGCDSFDPHSAKAAGVEPATTPLWCAAGISIRLFGPRIC